MGQKTALPLPRTVSLTCVRKSSGKLEVFDAKGRRIGIVDERSAVPADHHTVEAIAWSVRVEAMVDRFQYQFAKANDDRRDDAWERKFQVWEKSQSHPIRVQSLRRYFNPDRRATWDDAFDCMKHQFVNANRNAVRYTDPWEKWSETVSCNHKRKDKQDGRQARASDYD
jgi:hypothetical protein